MTAKELIEYLDKNVPGKYDELNWEDWSKIISPILEEFAKQSHPPTQEGEKPWYNRGEDYIDHWEKARHIYSERAEQELTNTRTIPPLLREIEDILMENSAAGYWGENEDIIAYEVEITKAAKVIFDKLNK